MRKKASTSNNFLTPQRSFLIRIERPKRKTEIPPQRRVAGDDVAPRQLMPLPFALLRDLDAVRGKGDGVQCSIEVELSLDRAVEWGRHGSRETVLERNPHERGRAIFLDGVESFDPRPPPC